MRIAHIAADAPQDLSISAALYTDEGFKTYEPRNMALFGDWRWSPDDQYTGWAAASPLTAYPYLWIFKVFGVSLASVRSLSILYALMTMIVLLAFLARTYDRNTALVGLIIFGIGYFTVMYNRLGLFENHLLFYLAAFFFCVSELFRHRSGGKSSRDRMRQVAWAAAAVAALAGGFFIKRNILIVFPAVAPAALIWIANRRGASARTRNRIIAIVIALSLFIYLVFGNLYHFRNILVFWLLSFTLFGKPLMSFLPFTAFDPIHLAMAKGLYMEFVFLQPLTFFAGAAAALATFSRASTDTRQDTADLFLASWLVFGLFFLTIMYYSPSRYYLMLVIPLVSLAARGITSVDWGAMADYFTRKKPFPHNILFALFILCAALYTGVVLLVQTVPVSFRNELVDRLYPSYLKGDYSEAAVIITAAALIWVACVAAAVAGRKRLLSLMKNKRFASILFIAIISLQMFQYGRWFVFHDHALRNASAQLGRELPPDAVIAGSWSAGLVLENRLKAVVIQSLIPYNHDLIRRITHDIPIPIHSIEGGKTVTKMRNHIPIYIAVCRNVIFERAIADLYRDHFVPENLITTFRFGFFRVEVYRMKKYQIDKTNVVERLFKHFL